MELVRFLEGSRARQTPVAVCWQGRWRWVRLVSESLLEEAGPSRRRRRRFLLQDEQGIRFTLEGPREGPWSLVRAW